MQEKTITEIKDFKVISFDMMASGEMELLFSYKPENAVPAEHQKKFLESDKDYTFFQGNPSGTL